MRKKFRERLGNSQFREVTSFRLNPPQSIRDFAENLGVAVLEIDLDYDNFGYLEQRPEIGSDSGYVIFVNKRLDNLEKRWTVAHELGHYFLHRDVREHGFQTEVHLTSDKEEYFLLGDEENEAENFAEDLFFGGGALEAFTTLHGNDAEKLASKVFGVPSRKVKRALDFYQKYRGLGAK